MLQGILGNLAGAAAAVFPGLGKSMWALACAECYADNSALGPGAQHSLDKAFLVLGLPTVLMFSAVFVYLYSRRRAWLPARTN